MKGVLAAVTLSVIILGLLVAIAVGLITFPGYGLPVGLVAAGLGVATLLIYVVIIRRVKRST
jgi:hypothetical protein